MSGSTNSKPSPEHTSLVAAPEGGQQTLVQRKKSKYGHSSVATTAGSVLKEHGVIAQVALNIIGAGFPAQVKL